MFEPRPLGLRGGHWSDRHGVIERHPTLAIIGTISRSGRSRGAPTCRGTRFANTCARTASSRSSASRSAEQARPLRRQTVADAAAGGGEVAQAEADDQAVARRSGRAWLRRLLQSRGGLRPRLEGRPTARAARPPVAAHSCRWRSCRARRSSSTGRRTGRSSPASEPSCRSPTSSSPTAAPSFFGPIRSRPMRCCSTPTTTPSACSAACRGAASTTTCGPPSTRSGAVRSARSTHASRPWSATSCSRPSSAIRRPVGRRGRSRRTCRTPVIGSGSRRRAFPLWRR